MLRHASWPINFFGETCYALWKEERKNLLIAGGHSNAPLHGGPDSLRLQQEQYKGWPNFHDRERLGAFQFDEENLQQYALVREQRKPEILTIFEEETAVGIYHEKGLYVADEHRRRGLATILILARATAVRGIPNQYRPFTDEGKCAMAGAYDWVSQLARLNQSE